jgi:glycosyltransferase involved in cell wall biosynthesis
MTVEPALRICMVTTFYPPYNFGGDGIVVQRLATELADRGHHVEIIHCVDAFLALKPTTHTDQAPPPRHPNLVVHSLKSRAGILSPIFTHQTGRPVLKRRAIKRILAAGRFDVVHFHNMSLIGPTAVHYTKAIRLYTPHEHWLVCPLTVLWKFNREPCTTKRCVACTLYAGRPPQLWRFTGLLKRVMPRFDAVVTPTRFTWDKHLEMGLPPVKRVEYLPHFLRLPPPASTTSPWPRPYFLYVGRLETMKGVQVLIDAFRAVPHSDLLICGQGTHESRLRQLAEGLPHVHFLGQRSHDELQHLYAHAVAAVVPSVGYEVFGVVILEALSQRTPVIVHELGALQEVVRDLRGGLLYRDVAGLRTAIETLRWQPELRKAIGETGYRGVTELADPDSHIRRYLALIKRLADAKAATAR